MKRMYLGVCHYPRVHGVSGHHPRVMFDPRLLRPAVHTEKVHMVDHPRTNPSKFPSFPVRVRHVDAGFPSASSEGQNGETRTSLINAGRRILFVV
ncbi:hypothetical protein M407DRAFT_203667 [Tulasnella calospora MUT 4182]|uniref:Uncharacterized protein n=1 Tax=Tulasnella calospora MUT 4182 TaxID=1051891 RepID=A0A0C3Q8J3_9AGAM|nr:hypothetical protein M407DRAFT_203667 [Tulasnella calospora MUT 4182]